MNIGTKAIEKSLSRNDTGETGGHQAGILVPKKQEILSFFPELGNEKKNPRFFITFYDHLGKQWSFSFIYYNNKFFGGTRNEFRLTGMTRYMNSYNIKPGDILTLSKNSEGFYFVKYQKVEVYSENNGRLKLSNSWKVVKI